MTMREATLEQTIEQLLVAGKGQNRASVLRHTQLTSLTQVASDVRRTFTKTYSQHHITSRRRDTTLIFIAISVQLQNHNSKNTTTHQLLSIIMAKNSRKAGKASKPIIISSDNGEESRPSNINSSPPTGAQALYDNDADEASELSSHDGNKDAANEELSQSPSEEESDEHASHDGGEDESDEHASDDGNEDEVAHTSSVERHRQKVSGEYEGGYEGDEDDEDEGNDAPVPDDALETTADDAPPASENESEDDQASLPVNSFERAANRSASHGATLSDEEDESSESDSEDIIVAPRTSQYKPADLKNTPQARSSIIDSGDQHAQSSTPLSNSDEVDKQAERQPGGGSSDLSELGATPEPPDSELRRLARQQRRRVLELCKCEGWCCCDRYKIFYGLGSEDQSSAVGDASSTPDGQKVGATAQKRPTFGSHAAEDEADEDVFGNPSSSRNDISSDANKQAKAPMESDLDFPSQTHLSERVLANEKFPESAMRSTIDMEKGKGKRRNSFEDEPSPKRACTKQVFSWDRGAKPSRPPTGWSGGEWVSKKVTSPLREVQDSEVEGADDEVHT
jgi:hypothetical protein